MRSWTPYCGAAPGPGEWLFRWNLDPMLLLAIGGVSLLLWRVAGTAQQRACVGGALALSLLLFVSPFCALSSALFAARVTHHVLLTAVIAPLLVLALPREHSRLPGSLALWTSAQAIVFWLWHAPPIYAAAMDSHALYWLMQLTLLASAAGFWLSLRRAAEPAAVAALLASTVQMGLLGAIITFAAIPLFAPHFAATAAWELTPLEDQQLAGLIMWAPSAAIYLVAALFIANRWLGREGRTVGG
jgi:putative membrane protein